MLALNYPKTLAASVAAGLRVLGAPAPRVLVIGLGALAAAIYTSTYIPMWIVDLDMNIVVGGYRYDMDIDIDIGTNTNVDVQKDLDIRIWLVRAQCSSCGSSKKLHDSAGCTSPNAKFRSQGLFRRCCALRVKLKDDSTVLCWTEAPAPCLSGWPTPFQIARWMSWSWRLAWGCRKSGSPLEQGSVSLKHLTSQHPVALRICRGASRHVLPFVRHERVAAGCSYSCSRRGTRLPDQSGRRRCAKGSA